MKISRIILSLLLIVNALAFTGASVAYGMTDECKKLIEQFNKANVGSSAVGAELIASLPKYCTEGDLFKKVSGYIYSFVGVLAVILFIYGGYLYSISGSNENLKKQGKEVLLYTVLGVTIVFLAVSLVGIVIRLITSSNTSY